MSDKQAEKTNDVEITTKIYPTAYKNRKGFRVGNMKVILIRKMLHLQVKIKWTII